MLWAQLPPSPRRSSRECCSGSSLGLTTNQQSPRNRLAFFIVTRPSRRHVLLRHPTRRNGKIQSFSPARSSSASAGSRLAACPPGLEGGEHSSHICGARHAGRSPRSAQKGLALLTSTAALQLPLLTWQREHPRRAAKKWHTMNPTIRRMPRQRQATRVTSSGGSAHQQYERYLARARQAQLAGDAVEVENLYQHAEHYFRMMRSEGNARGGHL
jgi:hypothetical protein